MKLPAVAIAAMFVCGVALGLYRPVARQATSHFLLVTGFTFAGLLLLAGIALIRSRRLIPAAAASVASWVVLGVVSAWIAEQPLPPDHVTNVMEEGRVALGTPLKWHGRLRDEPAKLPWGYGYEIDLTGVEYQGGLLRTQGGLRLSFTPHTGEEAPANLHAGDEITVLTHAKRPQVFRDEGAFDRRAYLASQNIDLVAILRAPELLHRVASARPAISSLLARARQRLQDEVDTLFAGRPEVAAVLRAMLLGDRSFLDRDESTDFQKTGVFHVLVVAGLHVGALAVFLFWIGRRLRLTPSWTILFILAVLLAYVAVVQQRPPVLRAALMVGIFVVGGFFYRRLELLNSAACAGLVLLLARPLSLRDSSFQLTFLAVGCIAGLALPWLANTVQPYVKALRGWRDVTRDAVHEPLPTQFRIDLRATIRSISAHMPRFLVIPTEDSVVRGMALAFRIWELFALTIVLQVGMLPLMARDFHRITLSAPLVNLLAVPLTGVVVPLGFLTLGSSLLLPALGRILAIPLSWITLLLLHVVQWFAQFPRWSYRIPGPNLWLVTVFFILAALLASVMRLSRPGAQKARLSLVTALIVCSMLIALFPFSPRWSPGQLELTVLDVGQGDSLFVVSPRGRTLLIDGGGSFGGFSGQGTQRDKPRGVDPGEEAVSAYLWSRGYKKLDFVALTHAHQDHLGGLTAVLQNFHVGTLWIGREVSSPALAALQELARVRQISVEQETRGNRFAWDALEGEFFWPDASPASGAQAAKNDDSLVLRLRYGDRAVLLPGDAEQAAESEILANTAGERLRADVLKVGHHGSRNSTTAAFLAAVQPRVAIISAGEDNAYGHPSPELLERLDRAGVRTLRTDRDGAIHVLTDGRQVKITCFVGCPEFPENSMQAQTPDRKKNSEQ